ncbi:hypothetical protein HNQ59_002016 [Chitinivorax tropicus]|uniref:DUF1835 domain-containing protein n=1 Tax=Chitinivorax tropicus TaxID=714531 RepID=A0A840MR93_9PROT|nr:DUF1835 domain-containing protein [Chitinivorax tropicus]MBB5018723.1 hypothetical protein [Chitinivorax tropicus]
MSQTRYVVHGDSATGCLKEMARQSGQPCQIIKMYDDLRIGPLIDADQPHPAVRLQWLRTICQAQWWPDIDQHLASLTNHALETHHHLLQALATPDPIVVWVGNTAIDQLMLAMIASLALPQTPLSVVDITGRVDDSHMGQFAVAMCPPESLKHLTPATIPPAQRQTLQQQWAYWKTAAQGWRQIDATGQLVDLPMDHLDTKLLATIAEMGRCPAGEVIGIVLNEQRGLLSDSFLIWRLHLLQDAGKVAYLPVERDPWLGPDVQLTAEHPDG